MKAQSVLRVIEWNFISKSQHILLFYPNRLIGAYFGSNQVVVKLAGTQIQGFSLQHCRDKKKSLKESEKLSLENS